MKVLRIVSAHEWHKSKPVQLLVVLSSLLTLVMASGAATQWLS
jgi:hypothetical protein